MGIIKIIGVISSVFMILQGCSGFQLSGARKEAIVDRISPNTVTVTFCGNAYMKQEEVEKLALQRASLEALSKGCSHFVIMNKEDKSKICALGLGTDKNHLYDSAAAKNPGSLTLSDFVEPNVTLTIRCVQKGEEIPENAINAEEYLNKNFPGLRK